MPWTWCPDCETRIQVPRTLALRDQLECPECTRLLEVINEDPLELDYAYAPNEELVDPWRWDEDAPPDDEDEDEDEFEGYQITDDDDL